MDFASFASAHELRSLVAQRIYAQCQGWEDINDHNTLRHDLVLQTAVGTTEPKMNCSTNVQLSTSEIS